MKQPKVVLWDIETLPMVTATFSLYPDSINHDNILQDWSIICAAWKYLGQKTIYSTAISDDPKRFKKNVSDDYLVVKRLREVFEDADIIIGHNSKKFDTKKLNARLIFHGLEPLPSGIQQVDTLTEVKKVAAFSSNRLDYLGKHLLGGGKLETSKGLWLRILKGDMRAVREMVTYNKGDVTVLEELYNKLLPYMKTHPHLGAIQGSHKDSSCPRCGSDNLINNQIRYSAAGVKKLQKQCSDCHGYSTFIFKAEDDPRRTSN